jgi:hypothetical protein
MTKIKKPLLLLLLILITPILYYFYASTSTVDLNYLKRMYRHSFVHVSKYDFKVGDKVMVAKDIDTNVITKKLKLSSFFFSEVEIV